MNLSVWAISRPAPVILLFLFLTFLGVQAFPKLPVQNTPDFDLPTVTISIGLPGAAPSTLETEITRLVEDSVASLNGLSHIQSSLTSGMSTTTVEFDLSKDVQEAVNDVRDAVSRVRGQFPASVTEPIVSRVTVSGQAILTFAVSSAIVSELDRSWLADNQIAKSIMAVPGVAKVTRQGGLTREITVTLVPAKLQALGVTAADVSRQLGLMQRESPGGRATLGGAEQTIRTVNLAQDVETLRNFYIVLADGRKVQLGALADVADASGERLQQALLDGQPVVSFQVYRATGYSEVEVATGVRKAVAGLERSLGDVQIKEVSNTTDKIDEQYRSSMHTLYEGAALAVLVVWLFLRDFRATVVAAVALPLSVIPTFFFLWYAGFSLNGITLLALTLVVGVLVDDAIVEVENIVRHLRRGLSAMEAAKAASTEIGMAVIATTFTLVAVFLPTAFMGGIPGKFFKQFGWTAAIAVLISLLVARMLTPLMAAYMLKDHPEPEGDPLWMQWYLKRLDWVTGNPGKTLGLAALFFALSMALVPFLEAGFIPRAQAGKTQLTVELAPGSSFDQTMGAASMALTQLKGVPEITQTYVTIGAGSDGGVRGGSTVGDVRKATILITYDDSRRPQTAIEAGIRQAVHVPGARASLGGRGSGESLSLVLSGDDPGLLTRTAQQVERELRGMPGAGAVTSTASLQQPELVVRPDSGKAADYGVTTQAIGDTVRVATAGDNTTGLAKLNLPERQIPIRVQLPAGVREDMDLIAQLRVPAKGGSVPLYQVAQIGLESGPSQLTRYDRSRNVTLTVELAGRQLGEVARQVAALPSLTNLPAGIKRQAAGDAERMRELLGSFGGAMGLGVLCIFGVLVLLLHSFVQPFTILSALPLAAGGALSALLVGGHALSLPSLIGLLMLMGVVTKNSILLVDYAILAREHTDSVEQAVREACHKRARPILMTSIAMVAGMLPLALGLAGGDSSFRAPMAVTVIGGLATSTFLSLLVVPAVFILMERGQGAARRWVARRHA